MDLSSTDFTNTDLSVITALVLFSPILVPAVGIFYSIMYFSGNI